MRTLTRAAARERFHKGLPVILYSAGKEQVSCRALKILPNDRFDWWEKTFKAIYGYAFFRQEQ